MCIRDRYKLGAEVIYESLDNIHVSGHACREEHKIMHRLLHPKFFIPVHGEYRHLKMHAQLAEEMGLEPHKIIVPDIGDCIELTSNSIKRAGSVTSGSRLIDGEGIEDEKASVVIEDRRQLSEEGLFIAVSYTHLRAHETVLDLVCRLLLEKNFFNDTATTEIYTSSFVGSVRCV